MTNEKHHISPTKFSMATKLGRMVTYLEGLLSIKAHGALTTWYYKITWQTKTIISLPPQSLWSPNLARWLLTLLFFYLTLPFGHVFLKNHVKNENENIADITAISQCLWPPNLVGWWLNFNDPTHEVTLPFDHVVLLDHMAD